MSPVSATPSAPAASLDATSASLSLLCERFAAEIARGASQALRDGAGGGARHPAPQLRAVPCGTAGRR